MWTHEPPGYDCPFCRLQQGMQDERNQAGDVIAVTELAYARISRSGGRGTQAQRS